MTDAHISLQVRRLSPQAFVDAPTQPLVWLRMAYLIGEGDVAGRLLDGVVESEAPLA
jgi:hypothetical protein